MGCKDKYICDLESQIQYLKKLLDDNGISYDYEAHLRALQSDVGDIVFPELGPEHASLLYSYFKGRQDVYSLRSSKKGYYTQYAHYLGIPIRLDWLAVNKKHFNFYIGAGVQADKRIYATVGNERLREKEVLFGLNGALGFQVNIVPMVGLYFEPEISYALNEGSIETFRYNEPLMISARAGLRFNF